MDRYSSRLRVWVRVEAVMGAPEDNLAVPLVDEVMEYPTVPMGETLEQVVNMACELPGRIQMEMME